MGKNGERSCTKGLSDQNCSGLVVDNVVLVVCLWLMGSTANDLSDQNRGLDKLRGGPFFFLMGGSWAM